MHFKFDSKSVVDAEVPVVAEKVETARRAESPFIIAYARMYEPCDKRLSDYFDFSFTAKPSSVTKRDNTKFLANFKTRTDAYGHRNRRF